MCPTLESASEAALIVRDRLPLTKFSCRVMHHKGFILFSYSIECFRFLISGLDMMNVYPLLAISDLLFHLNWQHVALRLGVALLAGAIIGLDRERKEKPAGLRTNMLVSLGSAFFVIIPIQLDFAQESADSFSRVIQGIITGVGFVGGGVILHDSSKATGMKVQGLTTAVAIWMSSALGIATGCGLWQLGLMGAVLSLLTLTGLERMERN